METRRALNWRSAILTAISPAPGVAFPAREVTAGSMNLNYSLGLSATGQLLKAGDYQSLIRFRMDYCSR